MQILESLLKPGFHSDEKSETIHDQNINTVALLDEQIKVTCIGHSSAGESGFELHSRSIILGFGLGEV